MKSNENHHIDPVSGDDDGWLPITLPSAVVRVALQALRDDELRTSAEAGNDRSAIEYAARQRSAALTMAIALAEAGAHK
jgi:hypothetical protein